MGAYTTVDDPSAHFQTALYSGNGGSNAITFDGNSNMQPDLVWIKCRANASTNHYAWDSNRGVHKYISPSQTATEGDDSASLTAFGSDGFTMGDGGAEMNHSDGRNYVGWGWKANGGTTSTLTAGSIDATVQTNSTADFSIITFTGNGVDGGNVAHGLSGTWDLLLIKNRDVADDWHVYHKYQADQGQNTGGNLNDNGAFLACASSGAGRATRNGANLINLNDCGDISPINGSSEKILIYAWKEVRGYSRFGSYKGNGNTDGEFVYTGFKPAWLIVKNVDTAKYWHMWDIKRSPFNVSDRALYPNAGDLEDTGLNMDLLSNGFKTRISSGSSGLGNMNTDGDRYIYIAFADEPFVTSTGIPCTAR